MYYPLDWKLISLVFRALVKRYQGLENLDPDQAYIFVPNHIGLIDSPFIASVLMKRLNHRVRFIADQKVMRPYGDFFIKKLLRVILVDTSFPQACLTEALAALNAGLPVAIYPEGSRNTSPVLLQGRTGVARLALASKKPVIPIGYQGPIPSSPTPDFWADFKDFFRGYEPIIIRVGQPVRLERFYDQPITYELLKEMTDTIMRELAVVSGKKYPY